MSHYSEMEFLFNETNNNLVTEKIKNTSNGNVFNIFKDPNLISRPGYTVFKNKNQYIGTEGIKSYLRDNIYNKSSQNNPYIELLNEFKEVQGKPGAGLKLKPSDFAYLKDLGVYPINRMAILRRFPEGGFVPEDLSEMKIEPISTIIGWIKPEQNFGTISFNESWTTTGERFDVALAGIIKNQTNIDISALVPIPDFAQGMLFEFYKGMGLTSRSGDDDSVDETYEYYDMNFANGNRNDSSSNTWGLNNIPVGDPNVLQEAPFRDPVGQNIKSEFSFELETTYEQKLLGDVDPGTAMLDILDNIYAMGTSNMVYYWGDDSPAIKSAKEAAGKKGNDVYAWWEFVKEIATNFWTTMIDFFRRIGSKMMTDVKDLISDGKSNDQKTQQNNNENTKKLQEIKNKKAKQEELLNKEKSGNNRQDVIAAYEKNIKIYDEYIQKHDNDGISNTNSSESKIASKLWNDSLETLISTLQTILTSTIAIHRFRLRGSIELMVGGKDSSAPWHLTIGNPFSPWINTSHIIIKSATIETSNELGFNDMPQRLTVKFNCTFSRSLGKQELMRMFNNSYRRTYSNPRTKYNNNSQLGIINTTANILDDTDTTTIPDVIIAPDNQTTPGNNAVNNTNDPSIVNYLQSKGQDYSYSARKKMASEMGIKNYRGTAEQNTFMLNTLRTKNKL